MTTEEKAKAYDEALKIARKINSGEGVAAPPDWTICEVIFPQLKESDDERIRKAILEFFKLQDDNTTYSFIPKKSILAWLEKQKENPKSADSIPSDCASDAKCKNRWHKVGDSLPDSAREVICKDAIGNFFIGRYYKESGSWEVSMYDDVDKSNEDNPPVIMWCDIPSEKQKEPDGTWTEEDDAKVKAMCKEGDLKPSEIAWLKELKNRIVKKEQKPAEWSEEDERLLTKLMTYVDIECFDRERNGQDVINWLRSLRPQLKQEWSEEDERKLNRIYEILGHAADDKGFLTSKRIIGDNEAIELQDFLKSLSPQPKQERRIDYDN